MLSYSFILFSLFLARSVVDCCFLNTNEYSDLGGVSSPKKSSCGHSQYYNAWETPGSGIVDGQEAKNNEFPWIVRLTDCDNRFFCAATIIDDEWLLTSAHCFLNGSSKIMAHFGDKSQTAWDSTEYSMMIDMDNSFYHQMFDPDTKEYDFALLKLPYTLDFSDWKVQKICLPKDCNDKCEVHNQLGFIHGWGSISEDGPVSDNLLTSLVYINGNDYCEINYETVGVDITDVMMCAGTYLGGADACHKDAGGPFIISEDGAFKICGVTSFGYGCGRAGYPGVYARVCSVLNWIHSYID